MHKKATFYEIKISYKRFKESTVKIELRKFMEKGILPTEMEQTEDVQAQSLSASQSVLTFDHEKSYYYCKWIMRE